MLGVRVDAGALGKLTVEFRPLALEHRKALSQRAGLEGPGAPAQGFAPDYPLLWEELGFP